MSVSNPQSMGISVSCATDSSRTPIRECPDAYHSRDVATSHVDVINSKAGPNSKARYASRDAHPPQQSATDACAGSPNA